MALAAGTAAIELDRAKPSALIDPFNRRHYISARFGYGPL